MNFDMWSFLLGAAAVMVLNFVADVLFRDRFMRWLREQIGNR